MNRSQNASCTGGKDKNSVLTPVPLSQLYFRGGFSRHKDKHYFSEEIRTSCFSNIVTFYLFLNTTGTKFCKTYKNSGRENEKRDY